MIEQAEFDSDNLIYNRFDLIYKEGNHTISFCESDTKYCLDVHKEGTKAKMNIWGKPLPQNIFENAIQNVFEDKQVCAIELTRCGNPYGVFLEEVNDIRVPLPDNFDELMNRAERRDRATIRRKLRWLDERVGNLKIEIYSKDEIPGSIVETYFKWKKKTHGTDYKLSASEYLDRYYVTDAVLMKAGETEVAVAFFCQAEDIVFFENFSYNTELKKYSPGLLMYVKFMEELIKRKCKYLYLGGGSYIYKKRFGAEAFQAYSGIIYRKEMLDGIDAFFKEKKIYSVAFYGYGVCGHSFLQLSKNLTLSVCYGIDQKAMNPENIRIYSPEEDLPEADAVLVTLNSKNEEVEKMLAARFAKVYYWNSILERIIRDYQRRTDEGA